MRSRPRSGGGPRPQWGRVKVSSSLLAWFFPWRRCTNTDLNAFKILWFLFLVIKSKIISPQKKLLFRHPGPRVTEASQDQLLFSMWTFPSTLNDTTVFSQASRAMGRKSASSVIRCFYFCSRLHLQHSCANMAVVQTLCLLSVFRPIQNNHELKTMILHKIRNPWVVIPHHTAKEDAGGSFSLLRC